MTNLISHYDLAVIIAIAGTLGIGLLTFLIYVAWDVSRTTREAIRTTRAVAGLVHQESEKIQNLLRIR